MNNNIREINFNRYEVALVQFIVNPRTVDATEATLNINSSDVTIDAEGYIGAVQMILSHGNDFSIELTDKAYVVDYNTESNQTILVVVAPESNELFTYNGDFKILDYIVANSSSEVSTTTKTQFFHGFPTTIVLISVIFILSPCNYH